MTSAEAFTTPHTSVGRRRSTTIKFADISMADAQTRACELLAELFPAAHILIVTRGFRSMILSSYSGSMCAPAARLTGELCAGGAAARSRGGKAVALELRFSHRPLSMRFWRREGDRLPYEFLRDDPPAFFREITRRLGLIQIGVPVGRPNPSLSPIELAWYPRLARRVRALPLGERGGRKAWEWYVGVAVANGLRRPIALMQRLRPLRPVTDAPLRPERMQNFRGLATLLREEPVYRPYARDYLFD